MTRRFPHRGGKKKQKKFQVKSEYTKTQNCIQETLSGTFVTQVDLNHHEPKRLFWGSDPEKLEIQGLCFLLFADI